MKNLPFWIKRLPMNAVTVFYSYTTVRFRIFDKPMTELNQSDITFHSNINNVIRDKATASNRITMYSQGLYLLTAYVKYLIEYCENKLKAKNN